MSDDIAPDRLKEYLCRADIGVWQYHIHANATKHGFWQEPRNIGEALALIHAEVSEALEAYRGNDMDTHTAEDGKPEGFGVELADIVIRVLDLAQGLDYDLALLMADKHAYNLTRTYKHGKRI
jgi:NTP pyrophosphatase (non-canonical NTP hydrolase)